MFSDHINSAPGREGRVRCLSEGSSEGGKAIAVRQRVNSLPGFAHSALAGWIGLIARDIGRREQAQHWDAVQVRNCAENRCNALRFAAIVLDTIKGAPRSFSGIDGRDQ